MGLCEIGLRSHERSDASWAHAFTVGHPLSLAWKGENLHLAQSTSSNITDILCC